MTERDWALLLHLAGFALLFSGMIVAAAAHSGARRRESRREIAALLALTRKGVVLVAAGSLVIVTSGLWLIELSEGVFSLGDGWIAGTLGLLALAFVLGGIGGQRLKRARKLAEDPKHEGDSAEREMRSLLDDPLSRVLSYAAALMIVAGLVIMVWKPGL
jgi:uncharacterized membrane protein